MFTLPPGWAIHPQNPAYAYEINNPNNMQPVQAFAHSVNAAPPQVPPAGPFPPGSTYGQQGPFLPQPQAQAWPPPNPGAYGAAPAYPTALSSYGAAPQQTGGALPQPAAMDVNAWLQENEDEERATRGWGARDANFFYVDFEKTPNVGMISEMTVRFMPDFFAGPGQPAQPCVVNGRHRLFSEYVPGDHGDKQVQYRTCFNQPGGPGDCPIDKACEIVKGASIPGASEHVANFRVEVTNVYQLLFLDDPTRHWVKIIDPTTKAAVVDQHGREQWKQIPAVIRAKKTLQDSIREQTRVRNGDFSHLQTGWPWRLVKKKTGPGKMDVEYHATALDRCPVDPQLYPILKNAIDLRKEFARFSERDHMMQIGENILKRFGLGWHGKSQVGYTGAPVHPGNQFVPHPAPQGPQGAMWNPHSGAVVPNQPPAQPPSPMGPPMQPPAFGGSQAPSVSPSGSYVPPPLQQPAPPPPLTQQGPPPGWAPQQPQQPMAPPPPPQNRPLPPPGAPGLHGGYSPPPQTALPGPGGPQMQAPPPPPQGGHGHPYPAPQHAGPPGLAPPPPPPPPTGPPQGPPPPPAVQGAAPPPTGPLTPEQIEAQFLGFNIPNPGGDVPF